VRLQVPICEQYHQVEDDAEQSIHRLYTVNVVRVAVIKAPVLLEVVEDRVLDIPAAVHYLPDNYRLHNAFGSGRYDMVYRCFNLNDFATARRNLGFNDLQATAADDLRHPSL